MKFLKNVFISHEGLVLKNFLLYSSSAYNLIGNKDNTFYFEYWKLTLEQYLVCKFGKSLKAKTLPKDSTYILIHSKWFNYSFWMTDSLVRLFEAISLTKTSFKLIYPENWDNISFVQETLALFPNIEKERIPSGQHLYIQHLLLPSCRKWSAEFDRQRIQPLSNYLLQKITNKIKSKVKTYGEKIYISRNHRNVRGVINEQELATYLKKEGFTTVYMEKLSVLEQIALMQNVKIVLTPHGAGCANLMFMQPQSFFIEMMDEQFYSFKNPMPYENLAEQMDIYYHVFICPTSRSEIKIRKKENDSQWRMQLVNNRIFVMIEQLDLFLKNYTKKK